MKNCFIRISKIILRCYLNDINSSAEQNCTLRCIPMCNDEGGDAVLEIHKEFNRMPFLPIQHPSSVHPLPTTFLLSLSSPYVSLHCTDICVAPRNAGVSMLISEYVWAQLRTDTLNRPLHGAVNKRWLSDNVVALGTYHSACNILITNN